MAALIWQLVDGHFFAQHAWRQKVSKLYINHYDLQTVSNENASQRLMKLFLYLASASAEEGIQSLSARPTVGDPPGHMSLGMDLELNICLEI